MSELFEQFVRRGRAAQRAVDRRVDYSTWLTKEEAKERIGVNSTKTIERMVKEKRLQAAWRREPTGPRKRVYQPDDVEHERQRRQLELEAFVTSAAPARSAADEESSAIASAVAADPLALAFAVYAHVEAKFEARLSAMSQTSETPPSPSLYPTIAEAAAIARTTPSCICRLIQVKRLRVVFRDAAGRHVSRRELEAL